MEKRGRESNECLQRANNIETIMLRKTSTKFNGLEKFTFLVENSKKYQTIGNSSRRRSCFRVIRAGPGLTIMARCHSQCNAKTIVQRAGVEPHADAYDYENEISNQNIIEKLSGGPIIVVENILGFG